MCMRFRAAALLLPALISLCVPLCAATDDRAARETEWRRLADTPALVRFRELTILKAGAWEKSETVTLEPRLRKAIELFRAKGDSDAGAMPLDHLEEAVTAFDRIRRNPAKGLDGRLNGIVADYCRYWAQEMYLVEMALVDPVQVALAQVRNLARRGLYEDALATLYKATGYRRMFPRIRAEIARIRAEYAKVRATAGRRDAAQGFLDKAETTDISADTIEAICRALANHETAPALAKLRAVQAEFLRRSEHPRLRNRQNWTVPFRKEFADQYHPLFAAGPTVPPPVSPVIQYIASAQEKEAVEDIARIAASVLAREYAAGHLAATRMLARRLASSYPETYRLLQSLPAEGECWDYLMRAAGDYKYNREYLVKLTTFGISDKAADKLLAFHDKLPAGRVRWRLIWALASSARSARISAAILARTRRIEDTQQRYYVLGLLVNQTRTHDDTVRAGLVAALKQPAEGAEEDQFRVMISAFMAGLPISRDRLKTLYLKTPANRRKALIQWLGKRVNVDLEDKEKFLRWVEKQPDMLKAP